MENDTLFYFNGGYYVKKRIVGFKKFSIPSSIHLEIRWDWKFPFVHYNNTVCIWGGKKHHYSINHLYFISMKLDNGQTFYEWVRDDENLQAGYCAAVNSERKFSDYLWRFEKTIQD